MCGFMHMLMVAVLLKKATIKKKQTSSYNGKPTIKQCIDFNALNFGCCTWVQMS